MKLIDTWEREDMQLHFVCINIERSTVVYLNNCIPVSHATFKFTGNAHAFPEEKSHDVH